MKHAGAEAFIALADVLAAVRTHPELIERKTGIFYRKSNAFLHFHEDPAGLFADVKVGKEFQRLAVNTLEEQQTLLACVARALAEAVPAKRIVA
jgi:hypothetical protein